MTVLSLLTPDAGRGYDDDWFGTVEESLRREPGRWVVAARESEGFGAAEAWELLGWAEMAASRVVRSNSRDTLVMALQALSLTLDSQLDQRDCLVVAALLRRAATLSNLEWTSAVREGCDRAIAFGNDAQDLLVTASDETPSTHDESGSGKTFSFVRHPADFDVDDLERWLEAGRDHK